MFSFDCAGLAWGAVVVLRARVAGLIRLLTFRSRGSLSLRCLVPLLVGARSAPVGMTHARRNGPMPENSSKNAAIAWEDPTILKK